MKKYLPYLLLLLANLIYGLNYSIAKDVMPTYIKPMGFVLLRAVTAMVFFWILVMLLPDVQRKIKFTRTEWKRILLCALFGVCLNQLCFFKGLELTAPISSSIIMTSVPILVLVLSFFILRNPLTPIKILGVASGLIGALVIIFSEGKAPINAPNPLLGNTLIMVNATSYSFYLILAKPLLAKHPPIQILKWLFTFGFIMVLPFGFMELQEVQWTALPQEIILAILFVLIFVSCLTYLFNLSALKKVNPSTVSVFIYSQPVFVIAFSLYKGNDTLTVMKIIGAILIFIGVYFVISSNFKSQRNE